MPQNNVLNLQRKIHCPSKQRGIVIVVALFMVALVAALAYAMMGRLSRDTVRTQLLTHYMQAENYAKSSQDWAIQQLQQNWLKQKNNQLIDHLPFRAPVENVNGYMIETTILDAQSFFNINNIQTASYQTTFKRLIHYAYPSLPASQIDAVVQQTIRWVQNNGNINDSKEDQYYLELPIPYRPAHRSLGHIAEWQFVKGVTPALYQAMQPWLIALPVVTPINVQTAKRLVLACLADTLTPSGADVLMKIRQNKPFIKQENFYAVDLIRNHPIPKDMVTFASRYFLVITQIHRENQHITLNSLVERNIDNRGKVNMITLWQSKSL